MISYQNTVYQNKSQVICLLTICKHVLPPNANEFPYAQN